MRPKLIYDTRQLPVCLDVKLVARLLDINEKTVRKLLTEGTLKGFKAGSQWRILKSEVMRFMGAKEPAE